MGFLTVSEGGLVITVVSIGLAVMSTLVRKKVLDQEKLKSQREEMKELNKKVKEAQKAGDNKAFSEHSSRLMELSGDAMKQQFKPMIFTLIPFLLVFNWMRGSYDHTISEVVIADTIPAGVSIREVNFSGNGIYNDTAGMLIWKPGIISPGNYSTLTAEFDPGGNGDFNGPASMYYKTSDGTLQQPLNSNATGDFTFLKTAESVNDRIKISLFYNNTKSNIVAAVGGFELGWLGWYILTSMAASMTLNKIFKVM
ncbi:MAG: EMC3/TMCO1 family protein [Candidatus Altiarchaeota archaeon]|nr:EMC3/TMCO1 family protein [Candidatus Altiarchaeota archaeon]